MSNIHTESVKEVDTLIKSNVPLIYIVTQDEISCIKELYKYLCIKQIKDEFKEVKLMTVWSIVNGLNIYNSNLFNKQVINNTYENTNSPSAVLNFIAGHDNQNPTIYVLKDLHTSFTPGISRQLKDILGPIRSGSKQKTIIIVGNMLAHNNGAITIGVEPLIEKYLHVVNWKLPTREQIQDAFETMITHQKSLGKKLKVEYSNQDLYEVSRSLQGLTFQEIEDSALQSIVEVGKFDPIRLRKSKKQIIMKSDILEYIESNNSMNDLGGLDSLKKYIKDHANSSSEDAIDFGVEPLKGILLVGLPGCAKSATAKSIGNEWQIPTLRLDVGKVMASLVGQSEKRMRDAISQAKAIAPCILWCDEIEKGLSGTKSSNTSDGGTLSRVFGTLLTAMEEELAQVGVVLVATANDITMLPPELIRRFSELFYVGLPTEEERKEIWSIHLNKKKRDPKTFDLDILSKVSNNYTGAEIEKALKESISICFNDGKRKVTTEDLVESIKATKPLFTVMHDKIIETQKWAKERARFASSLGEIEVRGNHVTTSSGSKININNLDEDNSIFDIVDSETN